ncbi:hypothetical protein GCM10023219_07590 [Stakelama sediminis]|uniref:ABC-2 type transport system permease protein n=1 Tax=Stakelama sediminis TaxID=463200 RepID=A0A840YV91_9SPHN|nr:hypothetical protein [Stakelama sediminis]MBB5717480.1 ABC-2 type transport system permease protein [Stakelama sediminis]
MMTRIIERLPAGSLGWLVAHELRLATRGGKATTRVRIVRYILLAAFLIAGILTAVALANVPIRPDATFDAGLLVAAIAATSLMTTQAMIGTQQTLYERGDLDLLFSSPVAPRTILRAKLLAIAATVMLTFGALSLPFVLPIAIVGHPRLLGFVATLIGLALIAACIGLALALAIAKAAGPRAARTVGQIAAGLLGGGFFILSQAIGRHSNESGFEAVFRWVQASGWADSWWGLLPGRASFGDPLAILILLGGGILLFALTGAAFQRLFQSGFHDAGKHMTRRTVSKKGIGRQFRASLFTSIFMKEWRLLIRDPALAFRIVLRLVYLIPLTIVLTKNNDVPIAPGAAFFSVLVTGQLVGSFTWLAISAEDSPDLLTVAPVEKSTVEWVKLASALAMAAPLALILPIVIATETVAGALVTLVMTAIAGTLAGFIELKLSKPASRKTFARRRSGSLAAGILTMLVTFVFGGIAGVLVFVLL